VNLKEYAAHRRDAGLRGTSHVAVLKAINSGRLVPPAIRKRGKAWDINPAEADRQWAANTLVIGEAELLEQPPEPLPARELQQHAEFLHQAEVRQRGGIPPIGESRAKKVAIEVQIQALELARQKGLMIPIEDVQRRLFPRIRAARDRAMAAEARITDSACAIFGGATQDQRRELSDLLTAELRGLCDKIREIDADAID
jgi:hypothetical protein